MRLIVIPISHYCERARWALQWAGLSFREERHLQMFHRRAIRKVGGRRTTPALVTADGLCLSDSHDIVQYAHENGTRALYPESAALREDIEQFEKTVAGDFGVETRRRVYFEIAKEKKLMLRYNNQGAPLYQRVALRLGYGVAIGQLFRYLKVSRKTVDDGEAVIDRVFADVGERLSDGRQYLFGDTFSAADLTFASMASPMIAPEQYGVALPTLDEVPRVARETVEKYRSLPAGKFALRVYRDDRGPRIS